MEGCRFEGSAAGDRGGLLLPQTAARLTDARDVGQAGLVCAVCARNSEVVLVVRDGQRVLGALAGGRDAVDAPRGERQAADVDQSAVRGGQRCRRLATGGGG